MRTPLLLLALLSRRIPPAGRRWRERVEAITGVHLAEGLLPTSFQTLPEFDHDGFLAELAGAPRWLGKAPIQLDTAEQEALRATGVTWPLDGWPLDQLGRVAMLAIASTRLAPSEIEHVIADVHRQGESRERQALLRALPLMLMPERFVGVAIDACRTNELPVFEAIACENPYPADHFPDLHWNQLVLKALFLGVALERIVGLERRRTAELARMAEGYASERRAAGRSVPADIDRILRGT
ncbi:MAG TPA: EboA domain-containing protein [Candidatus Nanopelagicales bacterium]|nr:EboA domain-containing protein [Candidatus Nanopelagicales bacterium]